MRRLTIGFSALACCAATSSSSLVADLAGRYDKPFVYIQYGAKNVVSARDQQDDVVEIVPVSADAAYFRLAFIAGDEEDCGMSGIARAEGRRLVYYDPKKPTDGEPICKITIERAGDKLRVRDENGEDEGACARRYCGQSGSLGNDLPGSSKRPIRYMTRLKTSHEYRDAWEEWYNRARTSALPR